MNKLFKLMMGLGCLSMVACQTELPVDGIATEGDGNVKIQGTVPYDDLSAVRNILGILFHDFPFHVRQ